MAVPDTLDLLILARAYGETIRLSVQGKMIRASQDPIVPGEEKRHLIAYPTLKLACALVDFEISRC
jgi:hypothetical protein